MRGKVGKLTGPKTKEITIMNRQCHHHHLPESLDCIEETHSNYGFGPFEYTEYFCAECEENFLLDEWYVIVFPEQPETRVLIEKYYQQVEGKTVWDFEFETFDESFGKLKEIMGGEVSTKEMVIAMARANLLETKVSIPIERTN